MNRLLKSVVIVLLIMPVLTAGDAYAYSKLDFFRPVQKISEKIEKISEKIQEEYNKVMQELHEKIEKAVGGEGKALFDSIVNNRAGSIIKNVITGKFDYRDFSAKTMLNELTKQMGGMKVDYANLTNMINDEIEALEAAKAAKANEIEKEITRLMSERLAIQQALSENESPSLLKEIDELDKQVALLGVQKENVLAEDVLKSAKILKYEQQAAKVLVQMEEWSKKYSYDGLFQTLNEKTAKLFSDLTAEDENKIMYSSNINRFFIGKFEADNSENRARVNKVRREAYYKSYKNMMNSIVDTYVSAAETSDTSVKCTDASTTAEGVTGSMSMRICEDLQKAKAAGQYMEMILNEILFDTTKQMQSWTGKYKYKNADKDVTKFNLDSYILTSDEL